MIRATRVGNGDVTRERVRARLRPSVRAKLRKASQEWDVSESRLIEMALERLLVPSHVNATG